MSFSGISCRPARALLTAAILAAPVALTGCGPVGGEFGRSPRVAAQPAPEPIAGQPQDNGPNIGSGPARIGLILPLTQASGPSAVGVSLRNATELAYADSGANDVTFLVKDDRSTADGAREATQAALSEGADVFLGPLFAPNVRETARLARGAGKTVIAFSTDSSVAQHGVYLLSFLIENYVDRIVDFAASKGKRSFAALIPDNDYGRVAEAEFQAVAARKGVRVMAIEHYAPGGAGDAAKKIAALGDQIDALFIPEQAEGMAVVAKALTDAGLSGAKVQFLGTGVWNDARVLKLPAMQGAWFATPENGGFNNFAGHYRAKFGSDPTRIATLAYDGASLLAALAHQQGARGFSDAVLTNASGFNGADGVFRFRPEGTNERGLAVLQITRGSFSVISGAPKSFSGAPGDGA
jgi:branched-chain amino acid transport system substrate-binding protein